MYVKQEESEIRVMKDNTNFKLCTLTRD